MDANAGRALILAMAAVCAPPASAQDDVASFYGGRTMEMLVGATPGNDFDLRGRLIARFLPAHLPGAPTIVTRNMPGGGGVVAMNHMASRAARDGATLHMMFPSIGVLQAVGTPGIAFDLREFRFVGNTSSSPNVMTTWRSSGFTSVDDMRRREIVLGTTAGDSGVAYSRALNEMAGTKIRIVSGYPGGAQVNLAMERGEVQGRATNSWAAWKATKPDWIASGQLVPVVQIAPARHPELKDTPLLRELVSSDADRAVMDFLSASVALSRAVVTTPGVPAARLEALRRAFDATVRSREFLDEAQRMNLEMSPMTGEESQAVSDSVLAASPQVITRARQLLQPDR